MSTFEEVLNNEYGKRIDTCLRLYEYAKEITTNWPGRPIEDSADTLISALFGRSIDTFYAAIHLSSLGYGAQAAMLNRSLFEDMVDIHWIDVQPDAAVVRFEQHFTHSRMLLADAAQKYPSHYDDAEIPKFDAADRSELDKIFGTWGSKSWTGINLNDRIGLIEHKWSDDGRHTLHFFHDIAHRENNQTLHVSAQHINSRVEVSPEGDNVRFLVGPQLEMLDRSLFGSFWIFDNTIGLIHERFHIELDDGTRNAVFSARDFIDLDQDQIRDTGRNDPCPCGSGQKFKRCHGA